MFTFDARRLDVLIAAGAAAGAAAQSGELDERASGPAFLREPMAPVSPPAAVTSGPGHKADALSRGPLRG